MKIEVSIGEVFDKISILEIKKERIKDEKKLIHIDNELHILNRDVKREGIIIDKDLYSVLKKINEDIWDLEDVLREKEKNHIYDEEFIRNAELDSVLNDKRFFVKNEINNLYDSNIKEQKSYDHLKYEVK